MQLCRWIKDAQLGRIHIPGCMGAAVYGPGDCTCNIRRKRKELEDRIVQLETTVKALERALGQSAAETKES